MTRYCLASYLLALALLFAADAIAAPLTTFGPGGVTLREWGYRNWAPDLLHYRLDPTAGDGPWSLVDSNDRVLPVQIDGDQMFFVADLPKGETRRFRLIPGQPARGSLRLANANGTIEIGNEYFTLRLPAVVKLTLDGRETTSMSPPILSWQPRGGPWMGAMRFLSSRPVRSFETTVVRAGSVVFVYEARYRFSPGGEYVCRITVAAGLPYAEIVEELDGGPLRRDNRDFLILDLHRNAAPGSVEVVRPEGETEFRLATEDFRAYLDTRQSAQFEVSSFGGTGQAPRPAPPLADAFLLERVFPAARWGGLAAGISVSAPAESSPWRVGVVPLHVGDWRRAMALNAWGTRGDNISLALPLDARWAWWHLDTTDEQSPFSTHEHDPAFPEGYARRVWGLFFGGGLETAQDRHGFIGLDRYKDWLMPTRLSSARVDYPRAFVTPLSVRQIRAGLSRHPDASLLSSFFLISGKAEDALRHGREFLYWIKQQTQYWRVHGLSHYRQAETLHRAFLAEDALSYAGLPAAMRSEILLHIQLWAQLLAEPDHNPRGSGVHLGNNNMTINRTLALLYFAALLPDHPRYDDWMRDMKRFVGFKLTTQTAVDGVWIAAPNYQLYGPTRFLDTAINILRNTGYGEPVFADYHGRTLRYLAELTMVDRRFNGLRIIPGMGNSSNIVPSIFGLSLRAASEELAPLLRSMHQRSVGDNGIARLAFNAPHHAFNYWPGPESDSPPLTSRLLPTYGMVFRNHFATEKETAMLFRAGSNWSHWDTDVFNLILYSHGAPLSPGTGYGYPPASAQAGQAIYHNRVKLVAHDRKEVFGRVDAPIRDYAVGRWLDYAMAERYYPAELYPDSVPRRWQRQVLFVKSDNGAGYFVVRDSFPGNPKNDRSWWTWLNPGGADQVQVSGRPFSLQHTPRNRAPDLDRLPSLQGRRLHLLGKHGVDHHIWFANYRPLDFRARLTFDADVYLPHDRSLLDFSAHFAQGTETKTIFEAMSRSEDYHYVIYPQLAGQTLPDFTAVENGVIRIAAHESTDTVFLGDRVLRYSQDGIEFEGRAGAVRVFEDRVVLSLAGGSGRLGYRGHTFTGYAPFERVIPRDSPPGRTDLGGYSKAWITRVIGEGVKITGEPPFDAQFQDGAIHIETDGRPRVLLLDRPETIPRPRYLIDGREWMATWTDWPDSGFGRWLGARTMALSVPGGAHHLQVDNMRFPPLRVRRFETLIRPTMSAR